LFRYTLLSRQTEHAEGREVMTNRIQGARPATPVGGPLGKAVIQVTGAAGRLVGVVPRATLLAALATPGTDDSAADGVRKDHDNA
jgi:hypothetical protein